eukprot:5050001-Prymnesium_polylepis.2
MVAGRLPTPAALVPLLASLAAPPPERRPGQARSAILVSVGLGSQEFVSGLTAMNETAQLMGFDRTILWKDEDLLADDLFQQLAD